MRSVAWPAPARVGTARRAWHGTVAHPLVPSAPAAQDHGRLRRRHLQVPAVPWALCCLALRLYGTACPAAARPCPCAAAAHSAKVAPSRARAPAYALVINLVRCGRQVVKGVPSEALALLPIFPILFIPNPVLLWLDALLQEVLSPWYGARAPAPTPLGTRGAARPGPRRRRRRRQRRPAGYPPEQAGEGARYSNVNLGFGTQEWTFPAGTARAFLAVPRQAPWSPHAARVLCMLSKIAYEARRPGTAQSRAAGCGPGWRTPCAPPRRSSWTPGSARRSCAASRWTPSWWPASNSGRSTLRGSPPVRPAARRRCVPAAFSPEPAPGVQAAWTCRACRSPSSGWPTRPTPPGPPWLWPSAAASPLCRRARAAGRAAAARPGPARRRRARQDRAGGLVHGL